MRAKRLLSLALAWFMLFSLSVPSLAWAAEEVGHGAALVEFGGKTAERVRTYKVTIRVSPSRAKAKVYIYDRRDDGNYADAQGTKYKSGLKLPAGDYHYIATAKGYLPAEGDFTVVDKNVRIKVRLEKEGQSAPTAETQPADEQSRWVLYEGFYLVTVDPDAATPAWQLMPENRFAADPDCQENVEGQPPVQYRLTVKLDRDANYKVIQYAGAQVPFPAQEDACYTVAASGPYAMYFRPDGKTDAETGWMNGVRYESLAPIDAEPQAYYAVAVEQSSRGNITADVYTAAEGDTVTLTAVPDNAEKYELDHFTVDGEAIDGASFPMPAKDVVVSAVFKRINPTRPAEYTITWLNYDGSSLGTTTVDAGVNPTYNGATPARPANGSTVYAWTGWTDGDYNYDREDVLPAATGDATYTATFAPARAQVGSNYYASLDEAITYQGDGSSFTVDMLADDSLTGVWIDRSRQAVLDLGGHVLTVGGSGITVESGTLTITGTGTLRNGTYTITVADGATCTITGGTFNFDPSAWVPSTGYQVTKDKETDLWTVTRVTCELTLNYDEGKGTVTGAGEYPWGTEVTITATPAEGCVFVNWTGDIDEVTDPSYTFTITEDTYIEAIFSGYHSLTATCCPAEGGAVVGTGVYAGLKEVTLRAVPALGYRFTAWQDADDDSLFNEATYTFEMPDEDYSLTAVFEVDPDNQITEWNNVTVVVQGDPSKVSCSLWTKQNSLSADPRFENDPDARPVPLTNGRGRVPVGWHLGVDLEAQGSYSSSIAWTYEGGSEALTEIDSDSGLSSSDPIGSLGNGPVTVTLILDPVFLTLQPNGPAGDANDQKVPANWRTPIMANPFTWEGHTFTGWNTEADGSGTPYDDGASVTLTEDLTLYAQWAADSVYCTVSLSLKDCIDINFYVRDIPTADAGRYTAVYTFKGKTTTVPLGEATPYSTDATAGTSVYRFTVASCAASEMTEEVVFDVKIGEASALSNGAIHYSIQQYCDWVLDSSTETAKLKELCQAVLDYGTYAQVRFGSANAPANANHSRDVITGNNWSAADRAALAAFRDSAYRSIPAQSDYPSWLAKITCSLSLKSRTELNFYYALKDGCSADTFAVNLTVDGEAWTGGYRMTLLEATDPNAGPDRLKVTILNIPASKLGSVIVLGLEDQTKGGPITLTYSPMTYAANEDSSDFSTNEQANVNVCRALYRYYKAALAFFEQNN